MQIRSYIFIPALAIALLLSFRANALKDAANLALDKLEKGASALETVAEAKAEAEKKIESIKSGSFGIDAAKSFTSTINKIDLPKAAPKLSVPGDIGKNLSNADKTGEAVDKAMVPVYGKGKDSEVAYQQNRKRVEMQQNNISTLYSHALASRANLAKERDIPAESVSQQDSRELLQASHAFVNKTAKRVNDILFMEAQIAEFESTEFLTTVRNQAEEDDTQGGSK